MVILVGFSLIFSQQNAYRPASITWLLCLFARRSHSKVHRVHTHSIIVFCARSFARCPSKSADRSTKTNTTHYTPMTSMVTMAFSNTHRNTIGTLVHTHTRMHTAVLSADAGSIRTAKMTVNSSSKRIKEINK